MNMSSSRWNYEQEMDHSNYINPFQMGSLEFNSLDEFTTQQCFASSIRETFQKSSSSKSYTNLPKVSTSSSSHLISFMNSSMAGKPDSVVVPKNEDMTSTTSLNTYDINNYALKGGDEGSNKRARSPSHAQDHVMAERKRREKLAERIIALSAIVPGLKKMDRASILGDTVKYLKHLKERVKLLEEQAKKKSEESVVFVKKPRLSADDNSSSCDENSDGCVRESLHEIEARVSENNVLIRIHAQKQNGFVVRMLNEIEKLHLSVINISVLPFGKYAMDITVVAQMDTEFCLAVTDLVRNLRSGLQ